MRACLKANNKLKTAASAGPAPPRPADLAGCSSEDPATLGNVAEIPREVNTPQPRLRRANSQSRQQQGRRRQSGNFIDANRSRQSSSSSSSSDGCFHSLSCDANPLQPQTASNSLSTADHNNAERPPLAADASMELGGVSSWEMDEFLARVYGYHRRGGFLTIALEDLCQLGQLALVLGVVAFALGCVNYHRLLWGIGNAWERPLITRPHVCASNLLSLPSHPILLVFLTASAAMWTALLCRTVLNLYLNWGTRRFYARRLGVASSAELANLTWAEVLERLLAALGQQEEADEQRQRVGSGQQIAASAILGGRLTELDVCGRILRLENFTTALVSRDLLPLRARLPLLGLEVACLPAWLHSALHLALFRLQPWALFDRRGRLRPECRRPESRDRLAAGLAQSFLLLGLLGLVLLPFTLPCQVLRLAFRFAVQVKRRPALLAARRWSAYGWARLRHFNELPHQLEVRLARGYEPAAAYVGCFSSQLTAVLASNGMFFSGAGLVILIAFSALDPDLLLASQVVTGATALGMLFTVCLAYVPDENQVWCPEQLLKQTLGHIHYLPDDWQWQGREHKSDTLDRFGLLFQLTAAHLVEELISPVLTPLLLLFAMPGRCGQLVDFFRDYTVSTAGAGDVCALAVLDVGTDGRPVDWSRRSNACEGTPASESNAAGAVRQGRSVGSADSKVKLSLLQFHLAYPNWRPSSRVSAVFLDNMRRQLWAPQPSAVQDLLPADERQQQQPRAMMNHPAQPSCSAPTEFCLGNQQQQHVATAATWLHPISWQDARMSEAAIRLHAAARAR